MKGETEDVIIVGGVILLFVSSLIVDYAQSCHVIDYVPTLCVVEVATAIVSTVTRGQKD